MLLYELMGGLDLAALPTLIGIYDIQDPEALLVRLALIRENLGTP